MSSVCSCVVCTNEYSTGNSHKGQQAKNIIKHQADTQVRRNWQLGLNLILTIVSQSVSQSAGTVEEEEEAEGGHHHHHHHHHHPHHPHQLVETKCDNEKVRRSSQLYLSLSISHLLYFSASCAPPCLTPGPGPPTITITITITTTTILIQRKTINLSQNCSSFPLHYPLKLWLLTR